MGPEADRAADRALLVAAAEAGGRIALDRRGRHGRVVEKAGGHGPVSEADLAVNAALKARLTEARPGYGWLSEEDPDGPARLSAARVFVLDPIDGTRTYVKGGADFAVSVAVVEAGRAIAGAVHLPAHGVTYAAHLGGGARRDGAAIQASARRDLAEATATGARGQFQAEHWPGGAPEIVPDARPSLAYRLCLVAEGRYDLMVTFRPAWEWDIAAGSLIATEAGAIVTDPEGAALVFNAAGARAPGVIAAAPGLHGLLIARRRDPRAS